MKHVELRIKSKDKEVIEICNKYWQFTKDNEFVYYVKDIATDISQKVAFITETVRQNCTAFFRCNKCGKQLEAKIRSDILPYRQTDGLHLIHCKTCFGIIYPKFGEVAKPILPYNQMVRRYFAKLSSIYPFVFPKLCPSVFLDFEKVRHLVKGDYFFQTNFHFIIADRELRPAFAVDVRSVKYMDSQWNLRRQFLEAGDLKYFILPMHEDLIINNVPTGEEKFNYISELVINYNGDDDCEFDDFLPF